MSAPAPTLEDADAYEADAAPDPAQATNILALLTDTARLQQFAKQDVEACEAELKKAKERLRALEEGRLVELMDAAKQELVKTSDGWKLERQSVVRASVPEPMIPAASAFLEANGHGAIVKHVLALSFGKGEQQRAERAFQLLREAGFAPSDKIVIHHTSLEAAIRVMLKEGIDVPLPTLGGYIQERVKVTVPK
jgi:hypothetical protein